MTKIDIAKKMVNLVVGIGTSKIVSSIIQNNVRPEKVTDKVTVACASLVLASMAVDFTKLYTDDKIEEISDWWISNVTNRS